MAKTIKFNLVCDGHQVRTLEDLRNHFSIEDVLQYYRDKVLEKWLCVRGYNDELEATKKISAKASYDIIKELVSVFKIESDIEKIEYSTSIITYRESRILADQKRKEKLAKSNELYSDYFKRYEELTNEILENPTNKSKIQGVLSEIENQYAWIFEHDYRNFFYKVRAISPLAILCLLMNQFTRKFYIFDEELPSDDPLLFNRDVKEMYSWIDKSFSKTDYIESLGDNVVKKNNETGPRFVSLTQKKCLVIKLHGVGYRGDNCCISSYEENENFLKPDEINGKFLIMEGLQYQSQNSSNTLYYIEL